MTDAELGEVGLLEERFVLVVRGVDALQCKDEALQLVEGRLSTGKEPSRGKIAHLEDCLVDPHDIFERRNRLLEPLANTVHVWHHSEVVILRPLSPATSPSADDQAYLQDSTRVGIIDERLNKVLPFSWYT